MKINQRSLRRLVWGWCSQLGVQPVHLPVVIYPELIDYLMPGMPDRGSLAFCDLNGGKIGLDRHLIRVANRFPDIVLSMAAHEVGHWAAAMSPLKDVKGDFRSEEYADELAERVLGRRFKRERRNDALVEAVLEGYFLENQRRET